MQVSSFLDKSRLSSSAPSWTITIVTYLPPLCFPCTLLQSDPHLIFLKCRLNYVTIFPDKNPSSFSSEDPPWPAFLSLLSSFPKPSGSDRLSTSALLPPCLAWLVLLVSQPAITYPAFKVQFVFLSQEGFSVQSFHLWTLMFKLAFYPSTCNTLLPDTSASC